MASGISDTYDEDRIDAISRRVAAAIDAATFGHSTWEDVTVAMVDAFPGCWSSLANMGDYNRTINYLHCENMDPDFYRSYMEHFGSVNPWMRSHWSLIGSGVVALSEEISPARLFKGTEFYNDWLLPQTNLAASAVKIDGDRGETIQFNLHFSPALADKYGPASTEVLRRTRGHLLRSIDFGRLMRTASESAVAQAALLERGSSAAFVIDERRLLRDANPAASDLLEAGRLLVSRQGRVHFADRTTDDRFGRVLSDFSIGRPVDGARIVYRGEAGAWQINLMPVPDPGGPTIGIAKLIPPARAFLVLITNLAAQGQGEFSALQTGFGLTPSEIAFCRRLFAGDTVAEASDHLGIALETARTRLKSIFQKTGTSRQSQLLLLLAKLG